ncbi:MAG: MFS transporter [Acidimicrobiia bacterium]|nr:MFS transporter [Acidimicrobiia bacterium]
MANVKLHRRVFVSSAMGAFLVTANVSTMNVAFPDLEATFSGASRGALTWVLNAYTITFAALLIPAGRLADRLGRRQLFTCGLAVFAVASIAVGVAPSLELMIAARVAQGVGAALVTPSSLGLLLASTAPGERTATVARWGSMTALGVATGPSLGAFIVEAGGWRWAFLPLPLFSAASYLIGRGALPDTEVDPDAPLPDLVGAVTLALSMAAVSFAIVQVRPWGATSAGVVAAAGLAVALLVALVTRSRRHPAPALPVNLFSIRSFTAANSATAIQSGALSATLLVNILWLTGGWDYSIFQAGLATLPSPVIVALLAPLTGRLGSRHGVRAIAVPGSLVWALGIAIYVVAVRDEPHFLTVWMPGATLVAIGIAMTFPLVSAAAVVDVPPTQFSVAGGVNNVGRQLGATIGVAVLVSIVGEGATLPSFRLAWLLVALAGPLACIALGALPADAGRRVARPV